MDIIICDVSHVSELTALFVEMESFYFGENSIGHDEMKAYLTEKVFSTYSGVTVIGARLDGKLAGFATFSLMFPAPHCSGQAYMKDLFTVEAARGKGVGRELVKFIAKFAFQHGCSRLDWTAETSNPKAGEFYLSIGASLVEEKQYFRLEGEIMKRMVMDLK
ncbi:GNAT family N-acetyltransferase [Citrobacter braakii]|uniref:GNAT family N-acetyltransferase n=1 Tax=Citrobacter braakii TaxID=57706 RepID=UPI0011EE0456|nr:GNAT family N-acetyltransferase [Citrobacter braakii]